MFKGNDEYEPGGENAAILRDGVVDFAQRCPVRVSQHMYAHGTGGRHWRTRALRKHTREHCDYTFRGLKEVSPSAPFPCTRREDVSECGSWTTEA